MCNYSVLKEFSFVDEVAKWFRSQLVIAAMPFLSGLESRVILITFIGYHHIHGILPLVQRLMDAAIRG